MPFFALLAGAAGLYLRLIELCNVFDMRTGLAEVWANETIVLIAFSAVFLILALAFSIRASAKYKSPPGFEHAFGTDPLTYPFAFSLIGLIWFGATVKHFHDLNIMGAVPTGEMIFSALSALAAISVTFFAIEMYQDPRRKMTYMLSLTPTLFMCFWLILMYKQNATNPVLLSYCYQCLAIILATLSFYLTSGFVYDKPAPGKTILVYFLTIYFCFVTLADNHTLTIRLIFAAIIAVNAIYLSMILRNLRPKEV